MQTYYTNIKNKRSAVKYFYQKEDIKWHKEVHKNSQNAYENIEETLGTFSQNSEMFGVFCDKKLAAFFCKVTIDNEDCLEGFHVLKEYRNKEFFKMFWYHISQEFKGDIYTGIYEKNYDAIKHLLKNNFNIINKIVYLDKNFVILQRNFKI